MWDILLMVFALLFMILGLLGAFVPVLPGPPLSYAGLLLIHFTSLANFSLRFLLFMAVLTVLVTLADLVLPPYATRKTGGSRLGMYGAMVGLVAGIFIFAPVGIFLGPFLGAMIAELINQRKPHQAFRAAMGSFLGLATGILLKLILSLVLAWHTLRPIFG